MLELNGPAFLGAATQLARLHQIFSGLKDVYAENLLPASAQAMVPYVQAFMAEAQKIGARLSVVSAERFLDSLNKAPCPLTVGAAVNALQDIESRFADYLTEITLMALSPEEAKLLQPAESLLEVSGFSAAFPSAAFEVEEAAKCLALARHTAAVFHAMRMLEIGIKALAKRLAIPDPAKSSEKNWGKILSSIRGKIDEMWPVGARLPGSEGSAFEDLYAHLDAIRNPWRNATMHVETIYAPHEAVHIVRCSAFFISKLMKLTDENGIPPPNSALPL